MSDNAIEDLGGLDLRAMRQEAGLSQQRVAELADCSIATVALLERGYRPQVSTVLPRILKTLSREEDLSCTETSSTGPPAGRRLDAA